MKERKYRDMVQNVVITLLSILAVALFARTQLYSLGLDGTHLRALKESIPETGPAPVQTAALAAPVRVAITGVYGRCAGIALTTAGAGFDDPLGRCLAEALGSAQGYTPCGTDGFLKALDGLSLYYDFLEPLPLSVLAELAGGKEAAGNETVFARRLVLSGQGDGTSLLYLWDGGETCLRCTTAVSADSLEQAASRYELGGAAFAQDWEDTDLAPYSLLLEEPPQLPVLAQGDPLASGTDWLLTALGFNPRTRTRHTESSGTEIIIDGDRSLRIRPDKSVYYQGGRDAVLTVEAAGEVPTLLEAARGVGALLNTLLSPVSGDAAPYLQSVRQNGSVTVLRYGYQAGGVPIRVPGDGAAEVTLTGTAVTSVTLHFRQYTATEEASLLLPLRQALAVASYRPGAELSICYVDRGGGSCPACWVAE